MGLIQSVEGLKWKKRLIFPEQEGIMQERGQEGSLKFLSAHSWEEERKGKPKKNWPTEGELVSHDGREPICQTDTLRLCQGRGSLPDRHLTVKCLHSRMLGSILLQTPSPRCTASPGCPVLDIFHLINTISTCLHQTQKVDLGEPHSQGSVTSRRPVRFSLSSKGHCSHLHAFPQNFPVSGSKTPLSLLTLSEAANVPCCFYLQALPISPRVLLELYTPL